MTAEAQSRAVPARRTPAARPRTSERLRRQLFVERAFFLIVIAALVLAMVRQARGLTTYQITVDGRPVATLSKQATAEKLLTELRGTSDNARFRQRTEVVRVNPRPPAVMTEQAARSALAQAVKVVVPAHVILVNGRVIAALESGEQAEQVLARLRASYAGPKQKARFKESVRVEEAEIARDKVLSPDGAFAALTGAAQSGGGRTYRVKSGDSGWTIASAHDLTVERLAALNPGVDLNRLHNGQELVVASANSPVTVITVEERTELEVVPHTTQVQAAPDLPRGQRRVLAEGQDGQKTVRYRITRENGRVLKREVLAETVMRPPKPERVLSGTGA
jgi:hypothetical protein